MSRTRVVKVVRQRAPETPSADAGVVFWDEAQCCEMLGIGQTTLAEWRRDGMPHVKRGRVIVFVPEDVRDWLRSHYTDAPTLLRRAS